MAGEVLVPGGSEQREKEKQDNDWKSNVAAQALCASLRLRFLNRETLGVSVSWEPWMRFLLGHFPHDFGSVYNPEQRKHKKK